MMSSMNPQINNQRENLNILNKNFMTLNNNKINNEKNFPLDISGNNQINENEDNLSDMNNNDIEGENLYKKNINYTLETLTEGKRDDLFKKYETVETQLENLDKKIIMIKIIFKIIFKTISKITIIIIIILK